VRAVADEIVASHPNLVLSRSTPATAALMHASLPIVFVLVADPMGSGFVQNLGHPGFNLTGFSTFESSAAGKWLALLKEAAPKVSRIALLFNPETAPFAEGYLRSARVAAQALSTTVISAPCSKSPHFLRMPSLTPRRPWILEHLVPWQRGFWWKPMSPI
jgi:putative tryptophan/tyrosine transport system substrate-binding protein